MCLFFLLLTVDFATVCEAPVGLNGDLCALNYCCYYYDDFHIIIVIKRAVCDSSMFERHIRMEMI